MDLTPSDERSAPLPPSELPDSSDKLTRTEAISEANGGKLLPRETGHDIGMGSPVALSKEAVEIITRLRNLKVLDLCLSVSLGRGTDKPPSLSGRG